MRKNHKTANPIYTFTSAMKKRRKEKFIRKKSCGLFAIDVILKNWGGCLILQDK
jgi:hypothetical protein